MAGARSEWNRIVPTLKRSIDEADYGSLVAYCLAFARMKTAEAEIRSGTLSHAKTE